MQFILMLYSDESNWGAHPAIDVAIGLERGRSAVPG
jgi:hypothetical protein